MSEKLAKIGAFGGAVAIALGGAACKGPEIQVPSASISVSTTPETLAPPDATVEQYEPASLMANQAGLNLIYMPISNPSPKLEASTQTPVKETRSFRKALLAKDKTLLQTFVETFDTATRGRYIPKSVDVVKAEPFHLSDGCVKLGDEEQRVAIQTEASKYVVKDAINVVELDALPCGDDIISFAAYADVDTIPVVNRRVFRFDKKYPTSENAEVVAHEVGHYFGVDHAGDADCEDTASITSCKADVAGDQNSLMSYEYPSATMQTTVDSFTVPELYELGLLEGSEYVVNPARTNLTLHTLGSSGLKMAIFTDPNSGEPRYVSYENDPTAAFDIQCAPEGKKNIPDADILYTTKLGNAKTWSECYSSNKTALTASVQVRFQLREEDQVTTKGFGSTNDSLLMVDARKDSTKKYEPREDANITDGYVNSGETILKLPDTTVEIASFKGKTAVALAIS